MPAHFSSDVHAMATGMLLAYLLKADVQAYPIMDDEGNYTPVIRIRLDMGHVELTDIEIEVKG